MQLIWDITNKCNLRCKHCGALSLISENKPENKDWRKVLDYCKNFIDSISLLGGEPLLHPDIEEIIHYANLNGMKLMLITNGQVDTKILDNIMRHDISSIFVSIEGLEETHDKIRGKDSWKKAMSSLQYLININKNKLSKTSLGMNVVINLLNHNEIIDLIELTKEMDIFYQITTLKLKGNAEKNKETLQMNPSQTLDCFEKISQYHAQNPQLKINIPKNYPIINEYLNNKFGTSYGINELNCDALHNSIYADPYGNISPCHAYKDIQLNINQNIDWNEDFSLFEPFLDMVNKHSLNTVCTMCKYKNICIPCPLKTNFKIPGRCLEAMERAKDLPLPIHSKFKISKPYAIVKSEDTFKVFYPNLGLSTQYSIEGIKILESIKEFKALNDISNEVSIPAKIIYEFLSQEKLNHKVIEQRT